MKEFDNISGTLLPYSQNEIETVMKQIMYSNGITDVVYEGSNASQLASIVSYVIGTLNANTALNIQETILPLATKRMNILFGARQLGYEPHAIKSYKYKLLLKPKYDVSKTITLPDGTEIIDTNNKDDRTISIVKNTKFKCGDKYYYYVGPTLTNVITVSNFDIQHFNDQSQGRPISEITAEIPVVEGFMTTPLEDEMLRMIAQEYTENNLLKTKQDYMIGYNNVEEDYGLQVYLTYIDDDGFQVIDEEWTKSEQFLIDETLEYNKHKFVRKENIILNYPVIFFQFAGLGEGIRTGTQIEVNVLQSSGPEGIAKGEFSVEDTVLSEELEVIEYTLMEEGRVAETDDEIKDNATVFKNTANRAVTRFDYITLAKRHPLIQEADAWGGEDEFPKVMGNIWLSCTPSNQTRPIVETFNGYIIDIGDCSHNISNDIQKNWKNWYVEQEDYNTVFKYLDAYKIMTMELNYRHPLYINFYYNVDIVKYDISENPKTINNIAFTTINDFFVNRMENFDSEYLNSNLQRMLDSALNYNTGINYELQLTGTLCEDMIDKYIFDNYNKQEIVVSLSWPYEDIFSDEDGDIIPEMLPKIDGDFGYTNGRLSVDLTELKGQIKFRRSTDIMYILPTDEPIEDPDKGEILGRKIGEYVINTEKYTIELRFMFGIQETEVSIEEIFGPQNSEGVREYAEFPIEYYPFDKNLVNLSFSSHRIPRLREVTFKK